MAIDEGALTAVVEDGEGVVACVAAGGVFAANHNFIPVDPHVLITNRRLAFLSRKGMLKKRFTEDASWPLGGFTPRLNTNEGTALGPFMYFLTLFAQDGETVSAAFNSDGDRDAYRALLLQAFDSMGE